jgi:hypothetical protein
LQQPVFFPVPDFLCRTSILEAPMVSNCLNPACRVPFSHARNGRLFSVDRLLTQSGNHSSERRAEQYWLCDTCSQVLKVVVENGSILTVPIDVECTTIAR